MKKKRFVTKKIIGWKIVDYVFSGIALWSVLKFLLYDGFEWVDVYKNSNNIMMYIMWTLILLVLILIRLIPYLAIYIGFRYIIKRYNKSRATFNVQDDIDYYRDVFRDISPATMSMLMDLKLETTKDLGAMRLYYELNDIYLYEKDGIMHLNNPNNIKLNKSDDILLKVFFDKKYNGDGLQEWRENVICENINNNLITRKSMKERKRKGCGWFLIVHIISFFAMGYIALNMEKYMHFFDGLYTISQDDLSLLKYITSSPDLTTAMLWIFGLLIVIFVWTWSFISGFIYAITGFLVTMDDRFKRTKEGNLLAEKLYGMKNFIRDFSNLDEATKKHLVLWRDFLVYAVVLEENDIILKEISNMYDVNLLNYKNYNN